jgi:hypothetical protein
MQESRRLVAPGAARRNDLAVASDPVAEIYAGYVLAGTAFKVVLRTAFGLCEFVTGAALQRVTPRAVG